MAQIRNPNQMMRTPDRKRGILTTDDRDYLIGRKNLTTESENNTRLRIRRRIRNGIFDFEHLVDDVETKDVEILVSDAGQPDEALFSSAEAAVAFIFRMCLLAPETEGASTTDRFRELLENGIERAMQGDQEVLDFRFDLRYGLPRDAVNQLERDVERGEPLTLADLRVAVQNDILEEDLLFHATGDNGLPKYVNPENMRDHDHHVSR